MHLNYPIKTQTYQTGLPCCTTCGVTVYFPPAVALAGGLPCGLVGLCTPGTLVAVGVGAVAAGVAVGALAAGV